MARRFQALGTLELEPKGHGFLRDPQKSYAVQPYKDPLVPAGLVRQFGLVGGETISGPAKPGRNGSAVLEGVDIINGLDPVEFGQLTPFEELTVIDPRRRIRFETGPEPLTMRVIDLMTPIGMGQRGLIVAPPRTGKTILLKQMAAGITQNHPDTYLMVLLVDERPEEVTDIRRSVHGEVVASCNDRDVASHVRLVRLMIEKAKRHLECGEDVLILFDSLTRLGRAFNAHVGSSGRTMTGGLDIRALEEPKRVFGAARNIEHGGSLTIIASALIETGSRMDDFIFHEFKGTGNMELVLCRELANRRIWPAMDLAQSGTRKEELLLDPDTLAKSHQIRRRLMQLPTLTQQMEQLLEALSKFPSNEAFLQQFK
jgi:transcription termination factor Rho